MEMASTGRIPKTIHYIWVGGKPLTPLAKRCIESWKEFAPDYELRFWSEENSPMSHPYVKAMYAKRKWAFVSDYIRFWALEREGGIYLDADMQLLKPLDPFLNDGAFLGRTKDGYVAAGIIGSTPKHPLIRAVLDFYNADTQFLTENTSPKIVTRTLKEHPEMDVRVYGAEYFYPCDDGEACSAETLADAYATHHWAESWVPFARTRKLARRMGVMPVIKTIFRKS